MNNKLHLIYLVACQYKNIFNSTNQRCFGTIKWCINDKEQNAIDKDSMMLHRLKSDGPHQVDQWRNTPRPPIESAAGIKKTETKWVQKDWGPSKGGL